MDMEPPSLNKQVSRTVLSKAYQLQAEQKSQQNNKMLDMLSRKFMNEVSIKSKDIIDNTSTTANHDIFRKDQKQRLKQESDMEIRRNMRKNVTRSSSRMLLINQFQSPKLIEQKTLNRVNSERGNIGDKQNKQPLRAFKEKKILRAKVFQIVYKYFIQPKCQYYSQHHHIYNEKMEVLSRIKEEKDKQKNSINKGVKSKFLSQFQQEPEKKDLKINFRVQDSPKQEEHPHQNNIDFNLCLARELSNHELKEIFDDPRYFFPSEEVFKHVDIFDNIDIFNGDHEKIKEKYMSQKKRNYSVFKQGNPQWLAQKKNEELLYDLKRVKKHDCSLGDRIDEDLYHALGYYNEGLTKSLEKQHTPIRRKQKSQISKTQEDIERMRLEAEVQQKRVQRYDQWFPPLRRNKSSKSRNIGNFAMPNSLPQVDESNEIKLEKNQGRSLSVKKSYQLKEDSLKTKENQNASSIFDSESLRKNIKEKSYEIDQILQQYKEQKKQDRNASGKRLKALKQILIKEYVLQKKQKELKDQQQE